MAHTHRVILSYVGGHLEGVVLVVAAVYTVMSKLSKGSLMGFRSWSVALM